MTKNSMINLMFLTAFAVLIVAMLVGAGVADLMEPLRAALAPKDVR